MRSFFRYYYLSLLGNLAQLKNGVYVLNGHFLSQNIDDNPIIAERFLKELSNSARFINFEKAVNLIVTGDAHKVDDVFISFTFDDGFKDISKSILPSLEKHKVNCGIFINPNYVDGNNDYINNFNNNVVSTPGKSPMSWDEIRHLLDRGVIIGNHTLDHMRLNIVDESVIYDQVVNSKKAIEEKLGISCDYFAWPYGRQNDISDFALNFVLNHHKYVFSGDDYRYYKSRNNRVINRRHFEVNWPVNHLKYFLSKGKV